MFLELSEAHLKDIFSNGATPTIVLQTLWGEFSQLDSTSPTRKLVREGVLRHLNAPKQILIESLSNKGGEVLVALEHPSLSTAFLQKVLNEKNVAEVVVKVILARQPLADELKNNALVTNYSAASLSAMAVRQDLTKDQVYHILHTAKLGRVSKKETEEILAALATNTTSVMRSVYLELAESGYLEVQRALAKNESCPPAILKSLLDTWDIGILKNLAQNPAADAELLATVLGYLDQFDTRTGLDTLVCILGHRATADSDLINLTKFVLKETSGAARDKCLQSLSCNTSLPLESALDIINTNKIEYIRNIAKFTPHLNIVELLETNTDQNVKEAAILRGNSIRSMVTNTEANSFMSNLSSTLAKSSGLNLSKDDGLGGIDAQYALALPALTKYVIEKLGNDDSAILNFYRETAASIVFTKLEDAGSNILATPSITKIVSIVSSDRIKQEDAFVKTRHLANARM